MLKLDKRIKLTQEVINSPNITNMFEEADLKRIGEFCYDSFSRDLKSREAWQKRTSAAMDLALQVQKDKSFPWPGCSNITFPLITVASLQFHSRAYPALISGSDMVKCKVIGPDPDGSKTQQAGRVESYMSWQLLEQDGTWEEQEDRALINVPIVGTAFKKSYFSSEKGHNVSDLVLAKELVLNYWATSVESCPVKTHVIPMSRNKVHDRIYSGLFDRAIEKCEWFQSEASLPTLSEEFQAEDERSGLARPEADAQTPFTFLEQHCLLDLDGDGYEEPYIVTLERSSQTVARIVCRFNPDDVDKTSKGEIIRIKAEEYFTKIPFIPNPDGGIMDIGFGVLLGPLNESVNSALNQLFDAGTISNTAGGFLGRGAKIRGGVYNFSPFDWNRVDSNGDDLRKSIIPLPVREPSNVMFQLLSLLIGYTEKISGAVDITTGGNPGQNTPAQTTQEMVEQGQKVYSAIYKRIWRSLKGEFQKLLYLNSRYLPDDKIYFGGSDKYVFRSDFLGSSGKICPQADPNILSDSHKVTQAITLMNVAKGNPAYDQDQVQIKFLKAIKIPDVELIYKGVKSIPPSQPSEKVQVEMLRSQVQIEKLKWEKLQYISSLVEQRRLNEAKIISLYAQASLFEKQAGGVDAANQIAAFQAKIDALRLLNDTITQHVNQIQEADSGQESSGQTGEGGTGTVPQLEATPGNGNGPGVGQAETGGPQGDVG